MSRDSIVLILTTLIVLLPGCSDGISYWESSNNGGQTIVINKLTGELYAIQDGALRPIPRDQSRPWSGGNDAEVKARKNSLQKSRWIADDLIQVSVSTKYRGGRTEIQGEVSPCAKGMQPSYRGYIFGLKFQDSESFQVLDVQIEVGDLLAIQGFDGKCRAYSFSKRAEIAAEDWQEASNVNVSWAQFAEDAATAWAKENPKEATERQEQAKAERAAEFREFLKSLEAGAGESSTSVSVPKTNDPSEANSKSKLDLDATASPATP